MARTACDNAPGLYVPLADLLHGVSNHLAHQPPGVFGGNGGRELLDQRVELPAGLRGQGTPCAGRPATDWPAREPTVRQDPKPRTATASSR